MSYDYSENMLVQENAGNLLEQELGWKVVYAHNTEKLGENGTFGRKGYHEILLSRYFRQALQKLNPWLTPKQLDDVQNRMESHLSTASLMQINEEKYRLIRDGVPVTVTRPGGRTEQKTAVLIDFQNPENNHFLAVKELKIDSLDACYHKRTDIVGFVNGIPLLFVELKNTTVDVEDAYTCNYTDYLDTIPHLFYYNAFVVLSNGLESKVGTLGSKFEFFHEWKRLSEQEPGNVELETMLRGICKKENFLDLLENFILFDHSGGRTVKILARNHQYLGVNEAVKAYEARKLNNGKLGVFWHTQGSGKSYSMVFLAQKIRRKFKGSPTIVVLTDRDELNTQISDTFENCGLLGQVKASRFIATSGKDLVSKLQNNLSFIFTLIQKFNDPDAEPLYPDHDVLLMSDEAHRSQNGIYAANMVHLLPTASRIGFTGTPLFSNDNITERTFGGYISIYDFQRAVEDGATVPLYYENRGDKIADLENPEITDRILDAIEQADLDVNQREKLEQQFAEEIQLLTAGPRLKAIARDFVTHYSDLWTTGKAMFVCLNRVTCVRMYNFVQHYWKEEIKRLEKQIRSVTQQEAQELSRKLEWMKQTEMAVVISQEQNEIQDFQTWELDIRPHREKMAKRKLDKGFKDPSNPLRVVFVCAMWLTGFDVKCLSCLYLDKPLKAHTLMQTIARANRVAEGKSNGLIVDYIGIVKALRKALADYTANVNGQNGADPTVDKEKLIARILETLSAAKDFLLQHGFVLQDLVDARGFNKPSLLKLGAEAVSSSLEERKQFQTYASELQKMMKYANRENISLGVEKECDAVIAIYHQLQKKRKHANNIELMVQINSIISEYVQVDLPDEGIVPSRQFDISKIDFDLLRREFAKAKTRRLILKDLDELIKQRLDKLLFSNPQRVNYYERYQQIIEDYNNEQNRATIEKTFMDLMDLANSMDKEEQRYVREGFSSDEELYLYDLLFSETLSKQDIQKIKQVAVNLLAKVKAKISELDHWTEKQETKAEVANLIRDTLWNELPDDYAPDKIVEFKDIIYQYVFTRYTDVA